MLGYRPDEIEDNIETWKNLIHPEDLPIIEEHSKKHQAGETPFFKVEHRLKTKKGDWKWILNWGKIVQRDANGKPVRALGTHIDITDRKQAEVAIEKANREWQHIFQAVGHPTIILDSEHKVIAANQAVLNKTGKLEKELIGKKCYEIFHGKDQIQDGCPLEKMICSGHIETVEMEMEALQGTYLVSCTPVLDENGKIEKIIHIATEITKRKQAEELLKESEERFRSIFENAVMGIYRTTPGGQIVMANPALIRMLGYSKFEDLTERNLEKAGYEPDYPRNEFRKRIKKEKQVVGLESAWIKRDGTTLYVSENASAICDESGNVQYYEGTVEDISERKKAEMQIRQSLKEKEVLLKEIHHRVKNNLQVIISLLNLQAEQVQNKYALNAFKESNQRIRSMALVHEKLYQSENFATINFKDYVENMIQELFGAYKVTNAIQLVLNIEDTPLGISEAIPCGLILNELVSNALKYAFPENRGGRIHVIFRRGKHHVYELIVKDNGVGIPDTIDFNKTKSLGLLLVRILANQINGRVQLLRKNGTVFKIRFQIKQ
jgi:PAS domain S-box-containing protein